jgi:hypothetical protein
MSKKEEGYFKTMNKITFLGFRPEIIVIYTIIHQYKWSKEYTSLNGKQLPLTIRNIMKWTSLPQKVVQFNLEVLFRMRLINVIKMGERKKSIYEINEDICSQVNTDEYNKICSQLTTDRKKSVVRGIQIKKICSQSTTNTFAKPHLVEVLGSEELREELREEHQQIANAICHTKKGVKKVPKLKPQDLQDLWNADYYPKLLRGKCMKIDKIESKMEKAIIDYPHIDEWKLIFEACVNESWVGDPKFPFGFRSIFEKKRYEVWKDAADDLAASKLATQEILARLEAQND